MKTRKLAIMAVAAVPCFACAYLAAYFKCVERLHPVFEAQLLTYLRLTGKRVGLLINFDSRLLMEGIKRLIL